MKTIEKDIKTLTIEEMFDLEYKMHKKLSKLKKKCKLTENIYYYKNILIDINNIKEEYDLTNLNVKLRYLKNEYNFLKKLNNIKIKDINYFRKELFNEKTNDKSINNTPALPKFYKHISKKDLINIYENNIEIFIKKIVYNTLINWL